MITLYPHQERDFARLREAVRDNRAVLYQLPTGGGKTMLAAKIIDSAVRKGKRVWFICHRQELVDQTALTFDHLDFRYSYIAANYPYLSDCPVQICSVDTLKRRLGQYEVPDLCIWDEAHHCRAKGWADCFAALAAARHLGLTATPRRLDGKGLGNLFDVLVAGPTVAGLIEDGYLAKFRCFAPPGIDRDSLHVRAGEFKIEEAEAAERSIVGDLPGHYLKYGDGKLALVFATTIRHSEEIVQAFQGAGIEASHLDGKTPKKARRAVLRRFAQGEVRVISNVGLFGEGFDAAANSGLDVTVGCVISARPTQSLSLWLQQCGRALRRQDTYAVLLDHAGNALYHGLPDDYRTWSLDHTADQASSVEPYKQCPSCFLVLPKAETLCPECGHDFRAGPRRAVEHLDGELVELISGGPRIDVDNLAGSLDDLIEAAVKAGNPEPYKWAARKFTEAIRAEREGYAERDPLSAQSGWSG